MGERIMGDNNRRPLVNLRINCINCNKSVNSSNTQSRYRVFEQNIRVISLISNWTSPVIITEEDYICEACFCLALQTIYGDVDNGNDRCVGPSRRGHLQVCLVCGRSLVNLQSHLILSQTMSYHTEMIQIVENRIAPRQILSSDRLCHACFMHVRRHAIRNQESVNLVETPGSAEYPQPGSSDLPQQLSNSELPADAGGVSGESSRSESPESHVHQEPSERPCLPDTILRNYKRAHTASHCIFYGCDQVSTLHTMSDQLRHTLLVKYYVPILARICSEHLQQNSWASLYDAENSMSNFTVEQLEHMLSFVNVAKPFLDFSSMASVEQIDDHLFLCHSLSLRSMPARKMLKKVNQIAGEYYVSNVRESAANLKTSTRHVINKN